MSAKVLVFAGSLRSGSFNKKLAKLAGEAARKAGGHVTDVDLKDYPLPVFDEDVEKQGLPANVRKLKDLFLSHDALLISAPEYNSSISAALKNVIDWISRPVPNESPLQCFDGKVAGLMSASPGALGGLRGLVAVRSVLGNIRVIVLPDQLAISNAHEAFNDDGTLKDPKRQTTLENLARRVVHVANKLKA